MSEEKSTFNEPMIKVVVSEGGEVAIDTNLSILGATHLIAQAQQIMVEQELEHMTMEKEKSEDDEDNVVMLKKDASTPEEVESKEEE